MGILDKAKNSIAGRFGDEVVRKGDFAGIEEDEAPIEEKKPRKKREPRAPREPKAPKEKRLRAKKEKPAKVVEEQLFFEDDFSNDENSLEPSFSDLAAEEGESAQEILSAMNIQETFVIDEDVLFLDSELANYVFSMQVPKGYDMGEVDYFVSKTQKSIAEYVRLLRQRNDDVVKLALRISDLSVELNNMRFNSEVANGINIMAGSGDDDSLAVDLQEARSRAQRLQEELDRVYSQGLQPNEDELRVENQLRDQLSVERRENDRLKAEVQDLRSHLVLLEEEHNIEVFSERGSLIDPTLEDDEYARSGGSFQIDDNLGEAEQELYDEESSFQSVGRDHWIENQESSLPGYEDEQQALPDIQDISLPLADFEEEPSLQEFYTEEILTDDYQNNVEDSEWNNATLPAPDDNYGDYEEVSLPSGDDDYEEISLAIDMDSNYEDSGSFKENYDGSDFTQNPYQNLDEFVESNLEAFPEDPSESNSDQNDEFNLDKFD